MIKNPEIRDYPGLPSGPNVITKVFTRGRQEGQRQRRREDVEDKLGPHFKDTAASGPGKSPGI